MSLWGVGPLWLGLSFLYFLFTLYLNNLNPNLYKFILPYSNLIIIFLLPVGLFCLAVSGYTIKKKFKNKKLIKNGIFAYSRNPIYSSYILFIVPSLCILFNSWVVLTTPIFMYLLFKILIVKEESNLEKTFNEEYIKYAKEVGQILPKLKWKN